MVSSKNDALTKFPSHVDIIDLIDDKKTVAEITMIINEEFSEVSKKLSLMKIEELMLICKTTSHRRSVNVDLLSPKSMDVGSLMPD